MPPKKKSKVETHHKLNQARTSSDEESDDSNKQKRGRKKSTVSKDKIPKVLQNQTNTEFHKQDFENRSQTKDGLSWNFKIASWNVDGLRAWIKVYSN